ncbi:DNRLRE domain-containing protein [Dactylosporangium sp. NPDC051485]|uniref:DNRLRE domain-containing protein n=1 Tax=Dactylosporangium sp. NPDC051485 TaxID=3154846 RepID=UPI003449E03C
MSLVTVAGLLVAGGPGAAVQAAPPAKAVCPPDRPDRAAASITARMCGGKVEVSGERSETLQLWANPDGTLTAEQHGGPVRMRDGKGGWKAVDASLQADADGGVSAKAHPRGLKLSGAAGDGEHDVVRLGGGDDTVALQWQGRLPKPTITGTRATYSNVTDGVDLVIESTRTGYEQFFVVKTREALAKAGRLNLKFRAPGVSVSPDGSGGLLFKDKSGRDAGRMPQPSMWDAAVGEHSLDHLHLGEVKLTAAQRGASIDLQLTPDPAFLAAKDLTYPITIDPSVTLQFDTFVQTGYTTDQSGSTELKLGYSDDGGTWTARSFLNWDTAFLAGAHVNTASLYLWETHSWSCTAAAWEVWTASTAGTGTRWTAQPTLYAPQGSSTQTKGYSSACNSGWVSADIPGFFQTAANNNWATTGMGLKATSETNHNGWKRFSSSEGTNPPYAVVTFNNLPQVNARSTNPATDCVTGSGRPYVGTAQPAVRAQITDPEGSPVSAQFEWYTTGSTLVNAGTVGPQASGSTFEYTLPSGLLANGSSYMWRVRGTDAGTQGAWSTWCEVTVDTGAPGNQPGIASATFPENGWTGQPAGYTTSTSPLTYIPGTNTLTLTGDDNTQQVTLPFPVSFYGQSYSSAWVDTNGMLSFVDPQGSHPDDIVQLPNSANPNATIYAYAQDLIVDGSASIRTATIGTAPNRTFVIDWNNPYQYGFASRRQNAEVIFTEGSSTIKLDYSGIDNASEQGSLALVGMENADGTIATQFSYQTPSLNNDTAVVFAYSAGTPAVYAGTPASFTLSAGGTSDVASYLYDLDITSPGTSVAAATLGGTATVSLTPSTDGAHTLYARAVDRAGNKSPVRAYAFNVGSGSITSPASGALVATTSILQATGPAAATGVTFQWRRADTDAWATVPAADVTYTAGGGAVTWPVAKTAALTPSLNWNVKSTLGGAAALAGPLQVRAAFSGAAGTPSSTTPALSFTLDPARASAATTEIGPGAVNLITGDMYVTGSDVSFTAAGSSLGVSRGFDTRQAGAFDTSHMFGPGWTSTATAGTTPYSGLTVTGSLVQVKLPDGQALGFTALTGTTFRSEVGKEEYTLTYNGGTDTYRLAETEGTVVVFGRAPGAPAGQYSPTGMTPSGTSQSASMAWQTATVDGVTVTRPTQILAPVPAGVNCATLVRGCQALAFTYATATTATGTAQAGWGDYTGRVKQITFTAWDPATSAMKTTALSAYSYDSNGRLTAQWDPRLDNGGTHLWKTYSYNGDGTLNTLTPVAQEPWTFAYTTVPGDSGAGRLASVSRSALAAGTATTSVVYNVPVSGAGAPYDLSAGQTARWAQTAAPVTGTAVFDAGQAPNGNQPAGTMPSSWTRATITYLDANGRRVNVASPGGHIDASWFDDFGNSVRTLTAGNRAAALNASASDTAAEEATLARTLSTLNVHSADGTRVITVLGPMHRVTLASGIGKDARDLTVNTYDEGLPAGVPAPNLVTTAVTGVRYWDADGTQHDADTMTTRTVYDWTLRVPLQVIIDPTGLALTTRTTYDAVSGQVTSTTRPAGGATTNTPATTATVYYTAAANGTYAECGGHAEWANLACRVQPGGQAGSGPELPYSVTTYDLYGNPAVVTEKTSAGVQRTTTNAYDTAGRLYTVTVTAATGTAVPVRRNIYDPATAALTNVQSVSGGTVTAQTTSVWDTLGRLKFYTDAAGVQTANTYDLFSRLATTNDGAASRTYTYDQNGENRGLLTQVVDAQGGTFTGSYDADTRLVAEGWPNSIAVSRAYNQMGTETSVTYTKTGCGQSDCTLYRQSVALSGNGLRTAEVSSLSSQSYSYDAGRRLTTVRDTVGGQCSTRVHGYNTASDRTSLTFYNPGAAGACQSSTVASTRTWTYDTASRNTGAGYGYDALGRATTVPAADTQSPGGGNLTATYLVTDLVATLTQNGGTSTYTTDVGGERFASWHDGVQTHVNHYSDTGDNPSWTDEGDGTSTRSVPGVGGIAATATSAGLTWRLADLTGDLVATVPGTGVGLDTTSEATEYGALRNPAQVGTVRYAWQGGTRRAADQPAGIVLMGVRLYNPATGRFLSVDPLPDGSANRYDYCSANPSGCADVTGKGKYDCLYTWWKPCGVVHNMSYTWLYISDERNGNGWRWYLGARRTSNKWPTYVVDVDSFTDPNHWFFYLGWHRPFSWANIHNSIWYWG